MERQYKHAVGRVIFNLPAGYLNPDESPLACAQRELLEETGFKAKSWTHLGSFYVDGNRGCGKMHSFVASSAYRVHEPQNEDTEELEIIFKGPEDALQLLLNCEIITLGPALALSLAFLSPVSLLPMGGANKLHDNPND
jgi:ADP-ribose pyrophosphatase